MNKVWAELVNKMWVELVKKMWVELENKIRVELFQSFNRTYHVTTQLPAPLYKRSLKCMKHISCTVYIKWFKDSKEA